MAITRTVHIHEGPGGPFESMFVSDAAAGAQPGILLFPNFFGAKEWDFAKAETLAALGYKVLVVDYYGQGKRGTDMESSGKLLHDFMADRMAVKTRLLDALAELKGLPGVDTGRLGAIGFCAGGKCVLDLARAGADIKAGVSFHGVYDAPPFPNAPITASLMICDGWNDNLCPPEAKTALCKELAQANVDFQFITYSRTGHAFTADDVPLNADRSFGFQPDTNRRSWAAATGFLGEMLG
ncbi:putative dienelactone hydrolase [Sphingobium sp. SYK-6]|uniref:dienelactone hydrolase family protein n=1 Tax=Sphingobium sp. (strain NBRC 103272 / SYK-6) TaxID=627192 RepID=UPI0002276758|nr:dienelactone hydrolase family protein [Sphingobium sp. SYK-6]BAK65211.1 putative dienelactone hydrolase [Sphingobium sp. SYK-6]